jgi:signal transduction histidine kinase
LLHPSQVGLFGETREPQWNNRNVIAWRAMTLQGGDMHFTLENDNGMQQMVVCRRAGDKYTVIVSTDLERIGQAAQVMGAQMPFIAVVLLAVSVLGAWLFSRWFTRPINAISHAAKEIAKGNYNVRIALSPNADPTDELVSLAQDFNTMAYEVGRTAELQRDLIANISHDLRTPLTLIKGYAETVRDLTGDDPTKRTQQLDVIVDETDRLSALVNSVMELSKYSSGSFKLEPIRFDLSQLCEEVADRYSNICEQNGYTLELDIDSPCMVWADPESMSRVIHNLLGNAVHHVGADGWVALRVKAQPDGSTRVEVQDHGSGITAEDLPHIFDKYYRSRADAGKVGTGLGLSITKAILISHGYAFGVDSEVGKGSTFWFVATPPPGTGHDKAHHKGTDKK